MTRIVICSIFPIETAGLCSILREIPEVFETTAVTNPQGLADHIKAEGSHVVVADMTNGISLEILETLRATCPKVAVILWVGTVPTEFISQALRLGVLGILPKNSSIEAHLECIRKVSGGELWVESGLSQKLLVSRSVHLTPRERQLSVSLTQGLKNKEIAYRLGISEGTVKVYLSRLYAKLGVGDRLDLALLTLKNLGDQPPKQNNPTVISSSKGALPMPAFISIGQVPAQIQ